MGVVDCFGYLRLRDRCRPGRGEGLLTVMDAHPEVMVYRGLLPFGDSIDAKPQ
jgi:hypothetical protein